MSKLFIAITVCAAVLTVAHNSTTNVPVRPSATPALLAEGPLPPPDQPDPTSRSVEV